MTPRQRAPDWYFVVFLAFNAVCLILAWVDHRQAWDKRFDWLKGQVTTTETRLDRLEAPAPKVLPPPERRKHLTPILGHPDGRR